MNGIDHFADRLLEDAVRRGISDHASCKHIFVIFRFLFPVVEVGVSLFVAFDYAWFKSRLHAGGRVRPVRGGRDEQHFALRLSDAAQVFANDH